MKSNSIPVASITTLVEKTSKSTSPIILSNEEVVPISLFGPTASSIFPVEIMMPLENPKTSSPLEKYPMPNSFPID